MTALIIYEISLLKDSFMERARYLHGNDDINPHLTVNDRLPTDVIPKTIKKKKKNNWKKIRRIVKYKIRGNSHIIFCEAVYIFDIIFILHLIFENKSPSIDFVDRKNYFDGMSSLLGLL